jgi:hypothetical protein
LHIGKSSAGWNFGLRIYPDGDERLRPFGIDPRICELADWYPFFDTFQIFDEYGKQISAAEMMDTITKRTHPNGLLSRVTAGPEHMGPYATDENRGKPGKGTYDLCGYDFS